PLDPRGKGARPCCCAGRSSLRKAAAAHPGRPRNREARVQGQSPARVGLRYPGVAALLQQDANPLRAWG
ncbi:MAG TPA: hypothetical protein VLQ80_32440, partial [Candidatus Saccharimonadia bacterium]|nr:hypothetical protein [Candidatus Saccharimonadia bacterium]